MTDCQLCQGQCCKWFPIVYPAPLDDDAMLYLKLHGCTISRDKMTAFVPQPCRMLTRMGACAIYDKRPQVCRNYTC